MGQQRSRKNVPSAAVAIDLGGTKIAGGLVCYEKAATPPRVERIASVPTDPKRGGAAVLDSVVQLAGDILACAREMDVAGIGVGTAGIVDPADGSILYANGIMPDWTGQPVQARLAETFGMPAAVLGDVQAHALGEARWGAARGAHSCLCVGVGTGLGGAYVLDGRVLRGFRGAAGHLGHTLHPAAEGVTCACGGRGHVETVTAGTAISAAFQEKAFGDELDPALMGDAVSRLAGEGDPRALDVLRRAGFALGQAIGSWCNVLDPEIVVLSGSVTAAGPAWRQAVGEGFESQVLGPLSGIPLVNAALGASAPLVGAAENLLDMLKD